MKGAKRVVIIGQSAAGLSALESFRLHDKHSEVILITKEKYPPYTRVFLHYFLDDSITEDVLYIRDRSFFKDQKVKYINGKVLSIDPLRSKIFIDSSKEISFDQLLIATGASPIIPDIPGISGKDVYTFWSLDDVKRIKRRIGRIESVAIIGGGLIGIQAMQAFINQGKEVYIIEATEQLLSRIADRRLSNIIEDFLKGIGIHLRKKERVMEIKRRGRKNMVILSGGDEIVVDAVIVAVGAKPNFPEFTGERVQTGKGIVVDERMRSSINNIFAAGDVAESTDMITGRKEVHGLWSIAVEQGKVAGENMAGNDFLYEGAIPWSTLRVFNLEIASFGYIEDEDDFRVYENSEGLIYRKLVFRDDRIIGGLFLNASSDAGILYTLSKRGIGLGIWKEVLHRSTLNYGKILNASMKLLI